MGHCTQLPLSVTNGKENTKYPCIQCQLLGRCQLVHRTLISNIRLPLCGILRVDFGTDAPVLGAVDQRGADNVFWTHLGLVVVDVARTVRAIVAMDRVPRVANVGVRIQGSLSELEGLLRNDLVESVVCAGEPFARIAMAKNVGWIVELDIKFCLATVAFSMVSCHF